MKTTIDLSDILVRRGKELAAQEGVPFREIVEEGLRLVLDRRVERRPFRLRDSSVGGNGLQPGQSWELPRDLAYDEARV